MKKEFFRMFGKLFAILALVIFVASCSDDSTTEPAIVESEVLAKYFGDNVGYPLSAQIISATDLDAKIKADPSKLLIIDIRNDSVYKVCHIPGAIFMPLKDLYTYFKANEATIKSKELVAITCFTGQSAGYSVSLLRGMGFSNVKSLKFGMASWSDKFAGNLNNAVKNDFAALLVNSPVAKPAVGTVMPTLSTGKKTAAEIADARAQYLFEKGYSTTGADACAITASVVMNDPSKYFIINYWPSAQYNDFGHIPGAYNFVPADNELNYAKFLKALPIDKEIVVYCYTGQTSAYMVAYLRMMGYNARSLQTGMQGMAIEKMKTMTGYSYWDQTKECKNLSCGN